MAAVRSLLTRMRKLEKGRWSPLLAKLGGEEGWAEFQADTEAGIAEGIYDPRDMPVIIAALGRWVIANDRSVSRKQKLNGSRKSETKGAGL